MSIKRHTVYNLLGLAVPMAVSLVTIPLYLHRIGEARYGVVAIIWLFLGYFGLFDPGITRAATFHIARLANPEFQKERESVFWTALAVNTVFGLVGGVIVYFASRPLFMTTFKMPAEMRVEVIATLPWLAAAVPTLVIGGVLASALQARERFGFFNIVQVINTILSQVVPLLVAILHGPDLRWLIPSILITRFLGLIPICIALIKALPLGVGGRFRRELAKPLFTYGGWVGVTNLLTPILTTIDRLIVGSLLSAQAVGLYTVSFTLVTRFSVIPAALSTSLFPRLSRISEDESAKLANDSLLALAAVMTPAIALGMWGLPTFMRLWVGPAVASGATPICIILLLGIWVNALAYIPHGHLQATNRPDVVAKFHAYEVIPFIGILWLGLHYFGLVGAAWAWTLRVAVDAILLFPVAGQIPDWRKLTPGALLILLAAALHPASLVSLKSLGETVVFAAALVWAWRLSPALQSVVKSVLKMES